MLLIKIDLNLLHFLFNNSKKMLLTLVHHNYYPYNIKFKSICLLQNIEIKKKKNYNNISIYNYLDILILSFYNKDILISNLNNDSKTILIKKYFNDFYNDLKLNKNDLESIIKSNINNEIEFSNIKKIKFNKLLELISNIIYYCNVNIVKYVHLLLPEIFNNKITFTYIYRINNKNYNFLKSAIDNLNYDNIKYLIKEHHFSFWENLNSCNSLIMKKNKENTNNLLEILELDNINNYLIDNSIKNYLDIIKKTNSEIIIIKIFNQLLLKDNTKELLLNLTIDSVYNVKYSVCKYIFDNTNFHEFLTNHEWIGIINHINRFKDDDKNFNQETDDFYNKNSNIKNQILKSKIAFIIFNSLLKFNKNKDNINKILYSVVCDSYYGNTFGQIIRLPNIIKTLKLIIPFINLYDNYGIDTILEGLLQYGYINTIKYVFEDLKFKDYILDGRKYFIGNAIDKSLLNKNNKVCKYIIELFKTYNINLKYEFLEKSIISSNNKIIKLKILNKNYDLEYYKDSILSSIFNKEHYINNKLDTKIVYWSIAKFTNNKIDDNNTFILKKIVNCYNLDLLKKYINLTTCKVNIWEIINESLYIGYYFYDNYIQYLLGIAEPLKKQNNNIKIEFVRNCVSYEEKGTNELKNKYNYTSEEIENYKNNIKEDKYRDIIKYLKKNEINFDTNLNYSYKFLEYILNFGNIKFFKSAILEGIPFNELIKKHEKKILYVYKFNINPWLKLYYLIKKLEFRKRYRSKKEHNSIYTSSIVELVSKPPLFIQDKPILRKGGTLFYKDMDEFDILGDNFKTFIKPTHIEPFELFSLNKKKIYLSQKTDGILVKNINKNELYPPLNEHFNNIILDGEYIPKLNLYLIFNQRSNYTENTDYLDDYYELYMQHYYCQNNINLYDNVFRNMETIDNKLKQEIITILNFVKSHKDINNKKLWFPKTFWKIEDMEKNLDIISIMERCLKQFNLQKEDNIKNDGLIIMESFNKQKIYKYKPIEEMTADLEIDKKIWRCNWDSIKSKWIPYEIREDKLYSNPKYVIKILENYHNNPWSVDDIIEYKDRVNNKIYYQKKDSLNVYNKEYFKKYKNNINIILASIAGINNKKILDLGCGYLNNILWKNNDIIDGIDIDLGILEKYNSLKNKKNKRIFFGDLSNINSKIFNNKLDNYQKENTNLNNLRKDYNLIISNMSFHNVFGLKDGFNNLLYKINNITADNCLMIITFIDKNLLFQDMEYIDLLNGSYIKKINENKIKIYYSWTHKNPIIETILNQKFLEMKLNNKGWLLEKDLSYYLKNIILDKNNPWNKIKNSIKILGFKKN